MLNARILICDEDPDVAKALEPYLKAEGMNIVYASNGEDALTCLRTYNIDLMILDVMLPGMSGLAVCMEVRKTSSLPILILSAKCEEIDRVVGLETGADDYVTKPFSPREVAIRARKLVRRLSVSKYRNAYKLRELTLIRDSYETYINSQRIDLTRREFEILWLLAHNVEQPIPREQICAVAWKKQDSDNFRMIDSMIKRLRHKLFDNQRDNLHFTITAVYGIGYKLTVSDPT